MKKIKNIIKNNITLVIGIILGVATIFGMAAYAENASSVTYTNNSQSNVQGALDTLYTRVNAKISRDLVCPGCVYRKSKTTKYNVNSTSSSKTDANSKLTSSEYETDYTTLNSNYFLGHVIDSSGYILESYVCGINNGTFFCLRGVDSSQASLTYKPFYQENVNRMNKVFSGCNATTSSSNAKCSGDVNASVDSNGGVAVYVSGGDCIVFDGGTSDCYEY